MQIESECEPLKDRGFMQGDGGGRISASLADNITTLRLGALQVSKRHKRASSKSSALAQISIAASSKI